MVIFIKLYIITNIITKKFHHFYTFLEQSRFIKKTAVFPMPNMTKTAYENSDEDIVNVYGIDVPKKIETFQEAGLTDNLLKNIKKINNITTLTTVQKYVLPIIMDGKDVVICAQSGFGKTVNV